MVIECNLKLRLLKKTEILNIKITELYTIYIIGKYIFYEKYQMHYALLQVIQNNN